MRIITGKARGVKLRTLEGETTRPTAERTKEAVFSMIQFDIEGRRVLDAFAGSGQMGLEALSRGAARAVLIDKNKAAVDVIKKNIELTRMGDSAIALCADISDYLKRMSGKEKYDIVFLDPPYSSDLIENTLNCLIEYKMLANNATVICESGQPLESLLKNGVPRGLHTVKSAKYGIAYVTILKSKEENENEH